MNAYIVTTNDPDFLQWAKEHGLPGAVSFVATGQQYRSFATPEGVAALTPAVCAEHDVEMLRPLTESEIRTMCQAMADSLMWVTDQEITPELIDQAVSAFPDAFRVR